MPCQASKLTSASVAGIVPQPLHWNRPPQSPVWQCPVPALLNTQPVRPQNRVFRLLGAVMVTLCPAGRTQPVAASGEVALGAAATQMVCAMWLTNVTRRWPAAPDGGGAEAAGSVGEVAGADGVAVAVPAGVAWCVACEPRFADPDALAE